MGIDRQYIFNKVAFFLKKENKFFTSAELHMAIGVDVFRRIAEEIDYPKTELSTYIASGVWKLSTPVDFLKIDQNREVTYQDDSNTYVLDPKTQKKIGRHNILNADPGTPENYFMETESQIGIYPPGTSGSIIVPYVKIPTSLSTDAASNEIINQTYMAATYWTVGECMLKDNDPRFTTYQQLYNNEILRLRKRFGEMFEEVKDIEPDENY